MAKPKTQTAKTEAVPENQSGVIIASVADNDGTDREKYGDVKPTMVNGQYIGDATPAKRDLTLHEQIAAAFPNERQIAVVQKIAALVTGGEPVAVADVATPADLTEVVAQLKRLEENADAVDAQLKELTEANKAKDVKIAELEAKLAPAAAPAE